MIFTWNGGPRPAMLGMLASKSAATHPSQAQPSPFDLIGSGAGCNMACFRSYYHMLCDTPQHVTKSHGRCDLKVSRVACGLCCTDLERHRLEVVLLLACWQQDWNPLWHSLCKQRNSSFPKMTVKASRGF